MLRFYLIVIFPFIMHQFAIGVQSLEENKVYYKSSDAILKNETDLKNVIPIVIEGQPPLSEISSNNRKTVTTTKKINAKLNKSISNENYYNSSERTTIVKNVTNLNTAHELFKHPVTKFTLLSNSAKNTSRLHVAPVSERTETEGVNNTHSTVIETTRRTKPKPIVTIGEKEADMPIPASPTSKSPLGSPRKIDYIVPGVITVTALPLLAVVFYVLYKRGRDYWDKRHYRRMDFLIDGMYNE